jgi:hypothetical protein
VVSLGRTVVSTAFKYQVRENRNFAYKLPSVFSPFQERPQRDGMDEVFTLLGCYLAYVGS